ncbi:hypothetical protein B0I35DRAFT_480320 [Stachybotrys elegans]|uniref:Cellobiose dehydrogenase cytochrome domain-containing protein n=1 Tax=Stachybotrys elegans TaxID=80388 RepID=A0A8K0SPN9_9HYPO|nr:hypothetical protein B0I35DRAFT_480320 [Stachybotrys elegans]
MMRRGVFAAAAAAFLQTASAQDSYCDALGRCFASYTSATSGVTYGFAIPEADAAPFDLIAQVTAPITVGYAGIAFGSRMTNVPLLITWPNGDSTVASGRVAYSYSLPSIYEGATVSVLDGSFVNGTHWVSTVMCSGCSSWEDLISSPPNSLDPGAANPMGFVYSTTPVDSPDDPETGFTIHDSAAIGGVDFNLAQSADFEEWVGGGGGEEPAPTSTASSTTTASQPTASGTAPAELPIPTSCGLTSAFPLEVADGWGFVKIAGNVRTPRGMAVDSAGNLLVINVGVGLTVHTFGADGCIASSKTLISRPQLNHGVALTPDGATLYVSSSSTVWRYQYDSASQSVSGETVVVRDMFQASHSTRTVVVPPATPDLIIVSLGSHTNMDMASLDKFAGRALVKVFDISSAPEGGYDYTTEGDFMGYGLRNEIAIAVDPNNMIWGVENSADEFVRTIDGQDTSIVEDNPAEELNYLGDPAAPEGLWYGYPTCFTVWGGEQFPDGTPATGSQFLPEPNSTFSDATCEEMSRRPRLAIQAHSAPIDAKFDPAGENLFVTLHGSWNRRTPTGYKVVTIPFTNGDNGYEPVAAQDSREGYDDILWDPQSGCSSSRCFRPSGIVWDLDFTRLIVASDNSRQGELYLLFRTS